MTDPIPTYCGIPVDARPLYGAIPAGAVLDRFVAEKVMGWALCSSNGLTPWHWWEGDGVDALSDGGQLFADCAGVPAWNPSEDIAHAWEVIERMKALHGVWAIEEDEAVQDGEEFGWQAEVLIQGDRAYRARGATAPLAICRAALAAVG